MTRRHDPQSGPVTPAARQLRINTVDLLRQPGAERSLDVLIEPAAIDVIDDRVDGPLEVQVVATSGIASVTVSGAVTMHWHDACRRCLKPIEGTSKAAIDELYQLEVTDPDAELIEGDHIDLVPVVRQVALLELPDGALCRDDCAGLCPTCGVDRNETDCGCDTAVRDDRWAALDDLNLSNE